MLDIVYAQAAAPPAAGEPNPLFRLGYIVLFTIGIFYFLIIRPQQKKQKETESMLASIKKGDRVLTSGGVYGTVVGPGPKDTVVLRVSKDVTIEFSKQSIVQVVEREG